MSVYTYCAYGLHIQTEIVCPELAPDLQPTGMPDVVIRLLPPRPSFSEPLEQGYYEVRSGIFRLLVTGVGLYVIEEGRHVFVEPLEGASEDEVRLFLLGSALGALLYQRGLFPLHGSAIETKWGAMIFVGVQGAGKSTLAAQFHCRGYRLLSDDVCAVMDSSKGLQVLPALTQFRLCEDAYERLGSPEGARFHVDKFRVPLNQGYCSQPVGLRGIHVLVDHDKPDPHFEVLRGFQRVQHLLENLYRPQFLEGQTTQKYLMRMAGQIAQKTTIAQISRQRNAEKIDSVVDYLESVWEELFRADSGGEESRAPL